MRRNPKSPWNPAESIEITPREYEEQVIAWLKQASQDLGNFEIKHLETIKGQSGEYEFDGFGELTILGGAVLKLLVECKRYSQPVEREKVLAFHAKIQDVSAHKGIMFSTSGFQSGAIEYATAKGIALVTFLNGDYRYETRDKYGQASPPPWVSFPKYSGIWLNASQNDSIATSNIDEEDVEEMKDFLQELIINFSMKK